jgi:hypothetical protein
MVEEDTEEEKPTTPYTEEWPEFDNGSDSFSMEDSWLDRTGTVKEKS